MGRTTYYQYSSAYDHAYLTDQSVLVSSSGPVATFGIDGSGYNAAGATAVSTLSASLTTTNPDIIIVASESAGSSSYPSITGITDTAGLTWHSREVYRVHGIGSATDYFDTEEWYAYSTLPLTGDSITVNLASSTKKFAINVFGVSGVNNGNPFDTHSGLPATASGSSTSPSVSISTNNANNIILGLFMQNGGLTFTPGYWIFHGDVGQSSGTLTTMYSEDKLYLRQSQVLQLALTFGEQGLDGYWRCSC